MYSLNYVNERVAIFFSSLVNVEVFLFSKMKFSMNECFMVECLDKKQKKGLRYFTMSFDIRMSCHNYNGMKSR